MDCVFALMQWKWSRQSCLKGKLRKCAPCPPNATSAFKSTAHSLFENSVRSQVCSAALVSQHPDTITPPILDRVNQIKRHKPSTHKHAKQTSHLSGWTCEKALQIRCLLCNHCCLFLCAYVWVCAHTHSITLSLSQWLLILVCITKKQTTSLHCPVLLWPFLPPQGNVCFPAAWAWTVSLLTECCDHLCVQA